MLRVARCFGSTKVSVGFLRRALSSQPFVDRHVGISKEDEAAMLKTLGVSSLNDLIARAAPASILLNRPLKVRPAISESELLKEATEMGAKNQVWRSYLGQGYYGTVTPPVILRNMFENAGWVTQYTPYQAEISQGRMESLVNFQTIVAELTGLEVANASLLDEASAAAEAVGMMARQTKRSKVLIDANCHPQIIEVIKTFCDGYKVKPVICRPLDDPAVAEMLAKGEYCGVVVQYPDTHGAVRDLSSLVATAHKAKTLVTCVTDLQALTVIKSPGEFGVDIAVGNAQRFGVPLNFGGPHAGFMSTRMAFVKQMPGRLVGISRDASGNPAFRLALQTREQFIRKDRATSNICTAQALLANMAAMYVLYHGPDGIASIGQSCNENAKILATAARQCGYEIELPKDATFFDTIKFRVNSPRQLEAIKQRAEKKQINLRYYPGEEIGISMDETVSEKDLLDLLEVIGCDKPISSITATIPKEFDLNQSPFKRTAPYLQQARFREHRSELALLRYMKKLENKDYSLTHGMIPLGSCTMKLTATAELMPCSLPTFANIHPYVPSSQVQGYVEMLKQLEADLCEITGYDAICFQPKSGAAGEYAAMRTIQAYHASRGDTNRTICLIPESAHGTNPASAAQAGLTVQYVKTTANGSVDMASLKAACEKFKDKLASIMITYPSTCGVFDEDIKEICEMIHHYGGQVFMDGANFNAQTGVCRPGDIGSDASHLNLHKSFAIPHGGGGPGSGPIGVRKHLIPFLPTHPIQPPYYMGTGERKPYGTVSSSTYGSPAILPIPWAYIRMMGPDGLAHSSRSAILNANYMAKRLESAYKIMYRNKNSFCAHEFIVDLKPFKELDITPSDIGKRLQDYGFHAPTVSFPYVHGLMVEPTESENKAELDRFCDALFAIRDEIRMIESGKWDRRNNPIKRSPHTIREVTAEKWDRPYSRQVAAFPCPSIRPETKFWPTVSRVDDTYGDLHFVGRF